MTRAILKWRTARKRYRCEFCGEPVKPGERYVAAALPPQHDLGNIWRHTASHGEDGDACPCYWLVPYPCERPVEQTVGGRL